MITVDDRTDSQKLTHNWAVVAKDKVLSGWGGVKGGASRVAWTVDDLSKTSKLFDWVDARSDMKYANVVNLKNYRAPKSTAHLHIFVAGEGHPAFGS